MRFNILEFVKRMLPTFSKDDAELDMETSISYLEQSVIPSLGSIKALYPDGKFNSNEAKKIIADFNKTIKSSKHKIPTKGINQFATDLAQALEKGVIPNARFLQKEIDRVINDTVLSSGLTVYKAFLLRSVTHYHFMSHYMSDLCNYLLVKEAEYGKLDVSSDYRLNKRQESKITNNLGIFCTLLSFYGRESREFAKSIDVLPDVVIPTADVEDQIDDYTRAAAEPLTTLPMGFVGSPIFSIRLVFAQWQADRYLKLKDSRKLIELRCLHLETLRDQGENDENLEKEIVYLQKRLTDVDFKIAKYEEKLA